MLNVTVIGAGYVGLASAVCYAELGHQVTCVDNNISRIAQLGRGDPPMHEPGLREKIMHGLQQKRLAFTSDMAPAVRTADVIAIAVGTPPLASGEANLADLETVVDEIASQMNGYKIIMLKSTVPVGTNERMRRRMEKLTGCPFEVVSVPEFMREGSALRDTLQPDRIVIGADGEEAGRMIAELHMPLTSNIVVTDSRTAEMIKYASNAFLATKISFINEIANLCEKVGADVTRVAHGMGLDPRIGASFLNAGLGYGGSCFPKDARALLQIAGHVDYDFKLLKAVIEVNRDQRLLLIGKLKKALGGSLAHRTIGIWGLAFKPNTDDVREAPSIDIVRELLAEDAVVRVYDPVAANNFRKAIGDASAVAYCDNALHAAEGCDAVCLLTEWNEFRAVDLKRLERTMKRPVLIDGRNVYTSEQIRQANLIYDSIGRPNIGKPMHESARNRDGNDDIDERA